jgi:ribonuclease Z
VKTKHTIWADLEPVVRKWPDTTFVLTHFSLRYGDGEVRKFFSEMEDCPPNVVVWADAESE